MKVYLPECSAGWVDFWNGTPHKGGIFTDVNVDLMKTPLFVKAGSILPLGPQKQYASRRRNNRGKSVFIRGLMVLILFMKTKESITIMRKVSSARLI